MATIGERSDIERKVRLIGERIVKGKRCQKNSIVKWHAVYRNMRLFSSSMLGIGLGHPLIAATAGEASADGFSTAIQAFEGLPIIATILGVATYLVIVFLVRYLHSERLEESAMRSLSAAESFSELESRLDHALEIDEPISALNKLHEEAATLSTTYHKAINLVKIAREEIEEFTSGLIRNKCVNWNSAMPSNERRGG